ncbi:hypothetical protein AVEN_27909-1 [Araneus ventricosus]|uniref:Uncharacterized protein n=1 Tax=Araneus ventricosus TaxID=182803 RepID=A0A4Y2HLL5_ARAVE|nr:hypothetical protein AVEN_27909-1 [Araneus ventricosus]
MKGVSRYSKASMRCAMRSLTVPPGGELRSLRSYLKTVRNGGEMSITKLWSVIDLVMKGVSRYSKASMRCAMRSLTVPPGGELRSLRSYLKTVRNGGRCQLQSCGALSI